jgi:hypothetical protein
MIEILEPLVTSISWEKQRDVRLDVRRESDCVGVEKKFTLWD